MFHSAPVETEYFCDHMAIIEQLAANADASGMPRTPGRLLITTVGTAWAVELSDPDRQQCIRVLGVSCDTALNLLALLLRQAGPPWMSSRKGRLA